MVCAKHNRYKIVTSFPIKFWIFVHMALVCVAQYKKGEDRLKDWRAMATITKMLSEPRMWRFVM